MSILVFVETDNGAIKKSSLEAISYAAGVSVANGQPVTVLALGKTDEISLAEAGKYGASRALYLTDPRLEQENSLAYADVLVQAAAKEQSKIIILTKSGLGDSVAARAAAKLKAGLVSGVTELPEINGSFKVKRAIYTGKAFATVTIDTDVKILVIRKNATESAPGTGTAAVEVFSPELSDKNFVAKVVKTEKAEAELSLTDADIIVSGGRGMKGPENWQPLLDFAKALGAATGCSKPVSDLDWRPHHEHIGQTGIKVAPNLYIACGISGAIQHLAGVNGSKCIVVINKDPEAPFFKAADYGIVGDVFEVLPKLTKAVIDSQ